MPVGKWEGVARKNFKIYLSRGLQVYTYILMSTHTIETRANVVILKLVLRYIELKSLLCK